MNYLYIYRTSRIYCRILEQYFATKEIPYAYNIIIAHSRYVEVVIMMTYCGKGKENRDKTVMYCGFEMENEQKTRQKMDVFGPVFCLFYR